MEYGAGSFMRSFAGGIFPMPLTRRRPNSFEIPMFHMSASGNFRSLRRDSCFPEYAELVLREDI